MPKSGWDSSPTATYRHMVEAATEKRTRAMAMQVLDGVIMRSPVKDGIYRGNHIVSIDTESYDYDPDATAIPAPDMADIPTWTEVYIQNNSPYAGVIERGSENREPVYVYHSTFQAVAEAYRR